MKKISQKISLLLVLLISISSIVIFFRVSSLMRSTLVAIDAAALMEVNLGNATYIENRMKNYEKGLWFLAHDLGEELGDDEAVFKNYRFFMEQYPTSLSVYTGTKEGRFLLYPNPDNVPEGYDPRKRDWYIGAKEKNSLIWTEPYTDAITGKLVITAAIPIHSDGTGEYLGVVGIDLALEGLSELMASINIGRTEKDSKKTEGGRIYTINEKGFVVGHADSEMVATTVDEGLLENLTEPRGQFDYRRGEEQYLVIYKKLEELDWILISEIPYADIYRMVWEVSETVLIFGVLALIIAIVIGTYLSGKITKPICVMERKMGIIKNGDLTVEVDISSKDEVGRLASSCSEMIVKIKSLIAATVAVSDNLCESSENLAGFSERTAQLAADVSRTVDEIAQGAAQQALETEEGVRLSSELSERFEQLAEYSLRMGESAETARSVSTEGTAVVGELKKMSEVSRDSNERIGKAVLDLDENTGSIRGILETIKSIAAQTNLLALNASIEAARAGEVGKGFAVVADEIRKLAEGSDAAVSEIAEILSKTQTDSRNTVNIMAEVSDIHARQQESVEKVDATFHDISKSIESIAVQIREMTAQVEAIKRDKDEIVLAMEHISGISEETAAAAEEVTATLYEQSGSVEEISQNAVQLKELAGELMKRLGNFKI